MPDTRSTYDHAWRGTHAGGNANNPSAPATARTYYPPPPLNTRTSQNGAKEPLYKSTDPTHPAPEVLYRSPGTPQRDTSQRTVWLWFVAVGLSTICSGAYLGLAIRLFVAQPLLAANGTITSGTHRGIGYKLPNTTQTSRQALNAAISIPTSLLAWIVRRAHLLCSRRGDAGYLEPVLWRSHVAWSHPINYATSAVVFIIIVVSQVAASAVTVLFQGNPDFLVYSPSAMILHSACLLCLSLWACAMIRPMLRSGGRSLSEQFPAQQREYNASNDNAFIYPMPARSKTKVVLLETNLLWAVASGVVPLIIFAKYAAQGLSMVSASLAFDFGNYIQPSTDHLAPLVAFIQALLLSTELLSTVELFVQNSETIITRAYWEKLWSLRLTGCVRPESVVEGFTAIRTRPHLLWLGLLSAGENWAISNALLIEGRLTGTLYPGSEYPVQLSITAGFAAVAAGMIACHMLGVFFVACWSASSSRDGLSNFGYKAMWLESGIAQAQRGDTWGSPIQPSTNGVGLLGWGSGVVRPPPPGQYSFLFKKKG